MSYFMPSLSLGVAYGLCFSNPIGVVGCALYGAAMGTSIDIVNELSDTLVANHLRGLTKSVTTIASRIFAVYVSFYPANFVCQCLGYSVNIIPSASLATSALIKGNLAIAVLSIAGAITVAGVALVIIAGMPYLANRFR